MLTVMPKYLEVFGHNKERALSLPQGSHHQARTTINFFEFQKNRLKFPLDAERSATGHKSYSRSESLWLELLKKRNSHPLSPLNINRNEKCRNQQHQSSHNRPNFGYPMIIGLHMTSHITRAVGSLPPKLLMRGNLDFYYMNDLGTPSIE